MDWFETEESKFLSLLKIAKQIYQKIVSRVNSIYLNSLVHKFIKNFKELMQFYLRYSFFARLAEARGGNIKNFLETSRMANVILIWVSDLKSRIRRLLKMSKAVMLIKEFAADFSHNPLQEGGIVISTAVIINIIITLLFHREISSIEIFYELIFLLMGILGIFSKGNWVDLRKGSIILSVIRKK